MTQDGQRPAIGRDARGVAVSREVADLLQAVRMDDRDWAADRRALNVQALVTRLGRGGRMRAAELLGVHVSAVDQAVARARAIRPSLTVDWTLEYQAVTVAAGELLLDPSESDDGMVRAAVAVAGFPLWATCTRHHDGWEDQAVLVVQRRGRPAALDNSIRYETFSVDVCRSCVRAS
ncbi:hypothetical protein [Streptomyces sp. NPDC048606]|uniref:hypothetical protein n=1 Tax=Streptomyces sp. NPDC048606 TaxID=3154726 RepID=UPI00341C2538